MGREYYKNISIATIINNGGNVLQYINGTSISPVTQEKTGVGTASTSVTAGSSTYGNYTLRIVCPSAGLGNTNKILCHAFIKPPEANKIYLRANLMRHATLDTDSNFYFGLSYLDAGNKVFAGIRYNTVSKKLEITGANGAYNELTVTDIILAPEVKDTIEISVDKNNGTWEEIIINGNIYDVSAYGCAAFNTDPPGPIMVVYGIETFDTNTGYIYIDEVIVYN